MQVQIQDSAALASIPSSSLRAYLTGRGWTNGGRWGDRASILALNYAGRTWEIWIPFHDTVADYAENMARSINILAQIEDRSQLDIYHDIAAGGADIIRLSALNQSAPHNVSLRFGGYLLSDAYALLSAAARAAEKPRPAYMGRVSADVNSFLEHVTPVPTDFNRFDLTLHSSVPARIGQQELLDDEFRRPFPRDASLTLASGLKALEAALAEVRASDTLDSFDSAVGSGVSANLCNAVAGLASHGAEFGDGIEIGLRWAAVHPPSDMPNQLFRYSRHSVDILCAAGSRLRRNASYSDQHLVAEIVMLKREPPPLDGWATLLADIDNHIRRVKVNLAQSEYDAAIQAHKAKQSIELDGDLYPSGNSYELHNPRNLRIVGSPRGD